MIKTLAVAAIVLYLLLGLVIATKFIRRIIKAEKDIAVFKHYKGEEGELVVQLMKDKGLTFGKAKSEVRKRKAIADNTERAFEKIGRGYFMTTGFITTLLLYPIMLQDKK